MLRDLSPGRAALLIVLVVGCSATAKTEPTQPAQSTEGDDSDAAASAPMAFTADEVQQLFSVTCVRCHAGSNSVLDLSSFAESTIGVPPASGRGAECESSKYPVLIAPGDREASLLWHKVNGTQDCGDRMPPTGKGAKLGADALERLGLFIDALTP